MAIHTARFPKGVRQLAALDNDWADLIKRIGPCRIRLRAERELHAALIRAVAYQQLHGRAAKAIMDRFLALYPDVDFPDPASVLATTPDTLRACGFSAAKITAIHGIAEQTINGIVPTRAEAEKLSDDELIKRLVTLRGVGRWTVEMLLIFTLGRPDVFPVDDFGVRKGYRLIHGLEEQPRPRVFATIGEAYAPYRSTAAWYLWRAADRGKKIRPKD